MCRAGDRGGKGGAASGQRPARSRVSKGSFHKTFSLEQQIFSNFEKSVDRFAHSSE